MTIRIIRQDSMPTLTTPYLRGILRIICVGLDCPDACPPDISLFVLDNARIRAANLRYRGKDKATDVLSFSQIEGTPMPQIPGEPPLWGDILISTEMARLGASERGHSVHEEVARLLVHGILHLLGHDHVRGGRQAQRMTREEGRLFTLIKSPAQWPFHAA